MKRFQENENSKSFIKYGGIAIIALIVLIVILNCFSTVPTGYIGIRTRFGKAQDGIIQEGLVFKAPIIENVVRIDCRTKKIETTSEASTKDLQTVNASIAVNYNVNKDTVSNLYREIGTEYENIIISPAILEAIKSTMAKYTAEELITKRSEVSLMIQEALIEKVSKRGISVTEFNITNIEFSYEYNQAIETKAVKQQEVITAKAELEKQEIQNKKEISIAEKDAKVMELQNKKITDKTLKLKRLEVMQSMIDKWNGVLPNTMLSENMQALFDIK